MLSGFLRVLCVIFAFFAVKGLFAQFRSGGGVSSSPDPREMNELVLYFFGKSQRWSEERKEMQSNFLRVLCVILAFFAVKGFVCSIFALPVLFPMVPIRER